MYIYEAAQSPVKLSTKPAERTQTPMARKTKEDALVTRTALLDAAERLFQHQGVARTTLQHIAQAAGVTRGALYWHFQDKSELFTAMLERVVLPVGDSPACTAAAASGPQLPALRLWLQDKMARIASDGHLQRVLDVVLFKSEYVEEMAPARALRLKLRTDFRQRLQAPLDRAKEGGELRPSVDPAHAAAGLHALLDGLIQDWLLEPDHDLGERGLQAIDLYLAGLAPAATAARS